MIGRADRCSLFIKKGCLFGSSVYLAISHRQIATYSWPRTVFTDSAGLYRLFLGVEGCRSHDQSAFKLCAQGKPVFARNI